MGYQPSEASTKKQATDFYEALLLATKPGQTITMKMWNKLLHKHIPSCGSKGSAENYTYLMDQLDMIRHEVSNPAGGRGNGWVKVIHPGQGPAESVAPAHEPDPVLPPPGLHPFPEGLAA